MSEPQHLDGWQGTYLRALDLLGLTPYLKRLVEWLVRYVPLRTSLSYPLRRLGRWLIDPNVACAYRWCARPQVGFSAWCREHTDRIMAGEDITDWPLQ